MNPQAPTRPVIDVAPPPRPGGPVPAAPVRPAPAAQPVERPMDVRLAPEEIAAAATSPAVKQTEAAQKKATKQVAAPKGSTPVGLIGATILCMLALSVIVTIIYFTAQST